MLLTKPCDLHTFLALGVNGEITMRVAAFRDIETKLGCLATATMCCNLPDLALLVEIASASQTQVLDDSYTLR